MAGKIINPGEYWPGVEPVKQKTWHKRLDPHLHEWQVWRNGADYVSDLPEAVVLNEALADRIIADHNTAQERYRDRHHAVNGVSVDVLEAVEQERDAYREALGLMAGLTREVIARETGLPRRQLTPSDVLLFCTAGAKSVLDRYPGENDAR